MNAFATTSRGAPVRAAHVADASTRRTSCLAGAAALRNTWVHPLASCPMARLAGQKGGPQSFSSPAVPLALSLRAEAPVRAVSTKASAEDVEAGTEGVTAPPPQVRKTSGKTAVVTGASQGSGRAIALALSKQGYNIVLAARQPERLSVAADEITKAGRRPALAVPTDVGKPEDVEALAAAVAERYEQVDIVVNVAGVCATGKLMDTPLEEWERQVSTNLMGAVHVSRAFIPSLVKTKGSLVNVNSFGGVLPLGNMTAYTASKFALDGFSKSLAIEMAKEGVHVGQVHPGVIKSDFLERAAFYGAAGSAGKESVEAIFETPTVQTPEDIAVAVAECVAERKAEIIVGAAFQAIVAAYRLTGLNVNALIP